MYNNQQQHSLLNKLRTTGIVMAIALIGGVGLSINKRFAVNEAVQYPVESQYLTPQISSIQSIQTAPLPTPRITQRTVILVPRTQAEFDCLQYGGGMGCFANNYTPNTPQYYSQQQQEWINWEAHQKRKQETLTEGRRQEAEGRWFYKWISPLFK